MAFVLSLELCNTHTLNTCAALPTTGKGSHVGISFVIGMTMWATSLSPVLVGYPIISRIIDMSKQPQMVWIYICGCSANDVIRGQTFWNIINEQFVGYVRGWRGVPINFHNAVAFDFCSNPHPASIGCQLDFISKPIDERLTTSINLNRSVVSWHNGREEEKPTHHQKVIPALGEPQSDDELESVLPSLCRIKAGGSLAVSPKEST